MFKFRNIDSFIPGIFERIGMLKGKRWYAESETSKIGLFKPKRYEHGDRKVFCANHYGEFMGYLLANNAGTNSCEAELAELSHYYANIHKERNHGTPENKKGCIIYKHLEPSDSLETGYVTIDKFIYNNPEFLRKLIKNDMRTNRINDNIEVVLNSIEYEVREFYERQRIVTQEYIEKQIKINKEKAIEMIIFDCLYGNNDRHDENWSMKIGKDSIGLYELYDNERVLGLYENQNTIENAIRNGNVEEVSENILFSRMRVPGENNKNSSYKSVLNYLMENYKYETKSILERHLKRNTPEKITQYLNECEGLPECYVEFGSQMYKSRYEYAKNLCKQKSQESMPKTYINFTININQNELQTSQGEAR